MAHKNHFSVLAEIYSDSDDGEGGTATAATAATAATDATDATDATAEESLPTPTQHSKKPEAPLPPPPLSKSTMTFTVTRGTHIIVLPSPEAHGVGGRMRGGKTTSAPTFYGRCYNCNYTLHSQKHCPLRQCTKCLAWGHADAVCAPLPPATVLPWKLPAADRASSDKTCATE